MPSPKNVFQKIIDGEIPAEIVHDDPHCLAFRDVQPQAPVHLLIVPKQAIAGLEQIESDHQTLLGHLVVVAATLARKFDLAQGYRLVINCGEWGGQTVPHLHVHLLGGRELSWPPG